MTRPAAITASESRRLAKVARETAGNFSGRSDYFAVNNKPMGYSTSYRVSGRLGECAQRFIHYHDADKQAKLLNRAYDLGLAHGLAITSGKP